MPGQQAQGALSVCLSWGAPGGARGTDAAGPQPTPRGVAATTLGGLAPSVSPAWSPPPLSHGTVFTAPSFPSCTFRLKDAFLVDPPHLTPKPLRLERHLAAPLRTDLCDFPGGPMVETCCSPYRGPQVRSLVGELDPTYCS